MWFGNKTEKQVLFLVWHFWFSEETKQLNNSKEGRRKKREKKNEEKGSSLQKHTAAPRRGASQPRVLALGAVPVGQKRIGSLLDVLDQVASGLRDFQGLCLGALALLLGALDLLQSLLKVDVVAFGHRAAS
eukprot:TRINITY_DN3020_c0_g1_i2.p1 TRINITY_DN3020_c0_g1~~TRINITY_DN3020_c0_g1_i2.p1  ORF type:complete len:131 (-),score=19.54 TRINITY_DN3020_c0_g1_i2:221-613(-)